MKGRVLPRYWIHTYSYFNRAPDGTVWYHQRGTNLLPDKQGIGQGDQYFFLVFFRREYKNTDTCSMRRDGFDLKRRGERVYHN